MLYCLSGDDLQEGDVLETRDGLRRELLTEARRIPRLEGIWGPPLSQAFLLPKTELLLTPFHGERV